MKRIVLFLVLTFALLCGSARADLRLIDSLVYGGPGETPWGEISGYLSDNVIEAGTYRILEDYREFGKIDASTPSYSQEIWYDIDEDGEKESYTGSTVGLFYAEAYADVSAEPGSEIEGYRAWGSSGAHGVTNFSIDGSQLSLHWSYEKTPADFGYPNHYGFGVYDQYVEENQWKFSAASFLGDPDDGTETLILVPGREYVLVWGVGVEAGTGFDYDGWARLTLDLDDIGSPVVPLPTALILGILGLGTAGMKLRKKTKE